MGTGQSMNSISMLALMHTPHMMGVRVLTVLFCTETKAQPTALEVALTSTVTAS